MSPWVDLSDFSSSTYWAHPCHIYTGTGLDLPLPSSAPGQGSPLPHMHGGAAVGSARRRQHLLYCSPLPHLRQDWLGCSTATSAPGQGSHLRRDWAHRCPVCAGSWLTAATSAPGQGSPLPHLHRDWAHRCHICTGTGVHPPLRHPRRATTPSTNQTDVAGGTSSGSSTTCRRTSRSSSRTRTRAARR